MASFVTGYSMVKSFRRCQKQYELKYIVGIQKKKPAAPLIRGTILHEMLHARATPKLKAGNVLAEYEKKFGELFREERDEYGEDFLGDIKRVYDGYLREYGSDNKIKYEASEEAVEIDIGQGLAYQGHLDKRIITLDDGRRWLMDHKTHKNIPDENQRLNDYQILMYLWAWNLGNPKQKADGIIWDYIRTKPPAIPEQLKNGQLTMRANIDTDVSTYLRELTRLKLDPKPYKQHLVEIEKRQKGRFYQRIRLPAPSRAMTENIVEDFIDTSLQISKTKRFCRNLTRDCSWCEFYRFCNAEVRGLDAKFIMKSEFEPSDRNAEFAEED
jgi:hypothetical protein